MRSLLAQIGFVVMICGSAAMAQATRPAAQPAEILAPVLDDQTFGVGRIDFTRVDVDAVEALLKRVISTLPGDQAKTTVARLGEAVTMAREWISAFKTAGGRELYFVASIADLPEGDKPFIIAPLGPGANADDMAGLLCSRQPVGSVPEGGAYREMRCEQFGQVVFAGSKVTLERLRALKPTPQPELIKALEAAGPAAASVGLALTADARRVLEEMIPTLPAPLGGGPTTVLTRGLRYVSIAVQTQPTLSLSITAQAQSPEAAKDLDAVVSAALQFARTQPDVQENPALGAAVGLIKPFVEGDRITVGLDAAALVEGLAPAVAQAQLHATRTESLSNIKQIAMACIMYSEDHRNQWPPDLASLEKYLPNKSVLINPRQPGRTPGYVYIRPPTPLPSRVSETLVVYEAFDTWQGAGCGFADGHARFIADKATFDPLLAAATRQSATTTPTPAGR